MRPLLKRLLKSVLRLVLRVRIEGDVKQFQHAQRLLVVCNHESFLDGLILGFFLPINPVFVVHTWVTRNRWLRLPLSLADYVAIDPTNPMSIKTVIKLVESGRPVVVFPEGRITTTGALMKIYAGPAFVAARTQATIIPVRLHGLAHSYFSRMPRNFPRRLFPRVTLSIQAATHLSAPAAGDASERMLKAAAEMRTIMLALLYHSYPKRCLYDSLLDAIDTFGRRRKVLEDLNQIEYNYGQLLKMTLGLGRLCAKVTAADTCVGILLPNLATTVCLLLGLSMQRRIPAMLNYTAGSDGLQSACTAACIKVIITSRKFIETATLGTQVAALRNVQILYLEDLRSRFGLIDKLWLLGYALWFPRRLTQPQDTTAAALVLFTSGSEGKPKGVVLSHHALLANIAQVRAVIDFSVDDKVLNALPIFHSFGLTAGALLPLFSGARLLLYPTPLHYRVIPEVAYDKNCTVLYGTSTFLSNYGRFAHPYDFYRVRYVIAGAEKLSAAVRELWFDKFGLRILEGYGATETAPVLAVNTPTAYRSGSVGQLLPAIEAKVLPVPGITDGGLLHVKGPNVMNGYFRVDHPGLLEPPQSAAGAGWYNTGDVVAIDTDGFVHIRGRVKRFAKIAGEMVALETVETLAGITSPAYAHAAATQPDAQRGECIVLFSTDTALDRERLQRTAREKGYADLSVPRKIVHRPELPLLGTGKIDYVTLQNLAAEV